jgi:hypothetical protein
VQVQVKVKVLFVVFFWFARPRTRVQISLFVFLLEPNTASSYPHDGAKCVARTDLARGIETGARHFSEKETGSLTERTQLNKETQTRVGPRTTRVNRGLYIYIYIGIKARGFKTRH